MTTEAERQAYREGVEKRYQEHLRLGPERCPCNVCRCNRESLTVAPHP